MTTMSTADWLSCVVVIITFLLAGGAVPRGIIV
jgi:hypothetical protein